MVSRLERFLQLRCICLALLETFLEAKVPFMGTNDASLKQIVYIKLLEVRDIIYYEKNQDFRISKGGVITKRLVSREWMRISSRYYQL